MSAISKKQEKIGVAFVLSSAAMWGIFPILVNRGTQHIHPIMFAAFTTLLAACGSFIYALFRGELHELTKKESYSSLIMITLCIVIIPYILFFTGSRMTNGLNSSMLLMSEIIFTLIVTSIIGEKTTIEKLIGALGILIGAGFMLYKGSFSLNIGDLLIIVSTITYPIGNFYTKKAMNVVSPSIILFVRFALGGAVIFILALFISPVANLSNVIENNWGLILFTGLILLGIGKVAWYEGLRRLDISKAISLGMTFPFFSLLILICYFKETPSFNQCMGTLIMLAGTYFSAKRHSVDPSLTKYAPTTED